MTTTMKMSRYVALLGSVITLVQTVLLANQQEPICLNDGCGVVDSLTNIPPIFFNICGFVFFQVVFWGIWFAGGESRKQRYVNVVLLAALAAEGVLVSFQQFVAQTFCSYCLIILSLVILLNILAGIRHLVAGAIVFGAVLASFASLQFSGYSSPLASIDKGTFAILDGSEQEKRYLFFSSTCKYCEKVIESLQEGSACQIRFNPIDEIDNFALEKAKRQKEYLPKINRAVLNSFDLAQIPVLLVTSPTGVQVIKGAELIQQHLDKNCLRGEESSSLQGTLPSGSSHAPENSLDEFLAPADQACAIDTDCEDPAPVPEKE